MKRVSARRIIETYFYMLTDGCGNPSCDNDNCVSSGKIQPLKPNNAAALAVNLLRLEAKLCELHASKVPRTRSPSLITAPPFHLSTRSAFENEESPMFEYLTENIIRDIVNTCRNESKYSQLVGTILEVFSKPDTLSKSFLKSETIPQSNNFSSNDLIGLGKEKLRELEGETEKDIDSSLSSKLLLNWDSDEIKLDFVSLRKSYDTLFQLPSRVFESHLIQALKLFADTCGMELKHELKDSTPEIMEKYVISFLIIFEMPELSTEYMEEVLPGLCKSMSLLPHVVLARICRVWARHCRTILKKTIDSLHHVIVNRTMFIVKENLLLNDANKEKRLQDDVDIIGTTKVMKVLYYANILAGKWESPTITEDDDYDDPETESKFNLFKDINYRHNIYQGFFSPEDSLAAELKFDVLDCTQPLLPYSIFYNEILSHCIQMDVDYTNYKSVQGLSSSRGETKAIHDKYFNFISYPFILTPATKTLSLFYDNRIRMISERRISFAQAMSGQLPSPYLKLQVRRDHLIEDTLIRLEVISSANPKDLKKQLVIEFEGEQGMDEGGISKEFFQLIIEEIFNPDYGMFTFDPDMQMYWFNAASFENDSQYTLIGLMLGLAIYNSIILDIRFPMVVYKKLLGKKGTTHDLEDFNSILYKNLKSLLEHEEDDVEEVYMLTFRITYTDSFGSVMFHDLIPGGNEVPVSLYNKQQFVNLYADFLLNKSVAKQFNAFRNGFRVVTDESLLKSLFRPEEIELLVCGSKNFDFNALQESTRYDGGYNASTSVVKYFWEFAHSLSNTNQRKLLQFTTGSDRVPVGGLGQLHMMIARNGPDSDRLPTAHTCFNILLLPEYSTKEKLFDRMIKAIDYSKGFGML